MPTVCQKQSLEATFNLFLQATGNSVPKHCHYKLPSAISRFLNQYSWSARSLIKIFRSWILKQRLQPIVLQEGLNIQIFRREILSIAFD